METPVTRSRYGVFVRFRKSRLPLRRGIASLEEAILAAEALRRERLHGKDDVFILREPDGEVIELPPPAEPPAARDTGGPAHTPSSPAIELEVAEAAPDPSPTTIPWSQTQASLLARLELARRAIDRAVQAQARFDRSAQAMEAALQRGDAPAALVEHHVRTVTLRAHSARALASFEAATAAVAAHAGAPLPGTRV